MPWASDEIAIGAWLHRIDPGGRLSAAELSVLEELTSDRRPFHAQQVLARQGEGGDFAALVLRGVLARAKETAHGHRQIISILVAGDLCSCGLALSVPLDHRLFALSDGLAAWISVAQLARLQAAAPQLMLPLGRAVAEENAITREWVVNVGARPAVARIAHLLCELAWRLDAVGLAEGGVCELPIRQLDLADATGLSPVHVNRVLQRLRKAGVLSFANGTLQVLDEARLKMLAGFDPAYLQVRETDATSLAWRMFQLGARAGGG